MMKLTKEECIKALNILKEQHDYLLFHFHSNYPYSNIMIGNVQKCFEQLINEHFDTIPTIDIEKFIEASEKIKNEPLRPAVGVYEVREIKKLEKALDKACELLEKNVTKKQFCVDRYGEFTLDVPIRTKKEWKEYLLK